MRIVQCVECEMRVLPKVDGSCPSCGASLPKQVISGNTSAETVNRTVDDKPPSSLPTKTIKSTTTDLDQPRSFDLFWLFFSFRGRIPRRILWIASILGYATYGVSLVFSAWLFGEQSPVFLCIATVASLALLWMWLALGIKRLHDLNWSGWLILLGIVRVVGPALLLYITLMTGTRGDNRYGEDPMSIWNSPR